MSTSSRLRLLTRLSETGARQTTYKSSKAVHRQRANEAIDSDTLRTLLRAPHDYELPRRHFLKKILRAAGLAAFGALPSGCTAKWSLLPPRPVSWVMKPLSSARTQETVLPDGRVKLHIEHDLLRDVTRVIELVRRNGAEPLAGQLVFPGRKAKGLAQAQRRRNRESPILPARPLSSSRARRVGIAVTSI